MLIIEACPACGSKRYQKNGPPRHGQQNPHWKACPRQFSAGADHSLMTHERRTRIENLLRERLLWRGICRAMEVSMTWLLHFMVECFVGCPDHLKVRLPASPDRVRIYNLEKAAALPL